MGLMDAVADENVRLTRDNKILRARIQVLEEEYGALLAQYGTQCSRADILWDSLCNVVSAFPAVLTKE